MKNWNLKIGTILVAMTLCGCVQDPQENGVAHDATTENGKIIFSSEGAEQGELLVKFSDEATLAVESHATRTGGTTTRSGIEGLDAVLGDLRTASLERVFRYIPKEEEQARAFGLHRWYTVKFPEELNLEEAARELATRPEVAFVQFNNRIVPTYMDHAVPCDELLPAATRSGESFFDDPRLKLQWHYKNTGDETLVKPIKAGCDINLESAWELCTGDPSIIVAVMDQGVEYSHEDLAANMWINEAERNGSQGEDDDDNGYVDDLYGYNFADDSGEISAHESHGTHVAGTISAVNHNATGVCGIAGGSGKRDGVKIMSIQNSTLRGSCSTKQSAEAIRYAADNGASILQCSWGEKSGTFQNEEEYLAQCSVQAEAIQYFINKPRPGSPLNGGIVIVSAGNDGKGLCSYPGGYSEVVCVTSIGTDFTPSTFTNYGIAADIAAPGGDYKYHQVENGMDEKAGRVLSTILTSKGKYGYEHGTSMACPHVSGVAALALSYAKQLGKTFQPAEFRSMLLGAVNPLDSYLVGMKEFTDYSAGTTHYGSPMDLASYRGMLGSGLVDAYKMLLAVRGTPAITVKQNEPTSVSLARYYGDVTSLEHYGLEADEAAADKLGLTVEAGTNGNATITCTKQGAALVRITSTVGGTAMSREVALISRAKAAGNGGWM